jgi:hypothetical protein
MKIYIIVIGFWKQCSSLAKKWASLLVSTVLLTEHQFSGNFNFVIAVFELNVPREEFPHQVRNATEMIVSAKGKETEKCWLWWFQVGHVCFMDFISNTRRSNSLLRANVKVYTILLKKWLIRSIINLIETSLTFYGRIFYTLPKIVSILFRWNFSSSQTASPDSINLGNGWVSSPPRGNNRDGRLSHFKRIYFKVFPEDETKDDRRFPCFDRKKDSFRRDVTRTVFLSFGLLGLFTVREWRKF